jgi:multiple sugar transport system permease protein
MPMMMAPIVVGLMWKFMYSYDFGIFQYLLTSVGIPKMLFLGSGSLALPSIIAADVWQWSPFMMLIILAGLRSIPREPIEAAMMDGASGVRVFADITLPLLKPVVLIAVLLRAIDSFRMFDQVFIMTRGGPGISTEVLSMYTYLRAFAYYYVGYATAIALIMLYAISVIATPLIKQIENSFKMKGT